jgi:NADPH-dependent curcumin reductase CurA
MYPVLQVAGTVGQIAKLRLPRGGDCAGTDEKQKTLIEDFGFDK